MEEKKGKLKTLDDTMIDKVDKDELHKAIREKLENWEDWKKECYNREFAVSPYSKKLEIKGREQ